MIKKLPFPFRILATLGWTATLAGASPQPDLELASSLPPDSVFYLSTAPLKEVKDAYQDTALSRIWKRLPIPSQPPAEWTAFDSALQGKLGLDTEHLLGLFTGSLALGAGPLTPAVLRGDRMPPLILRAGVSDGSPLPGLIEKLRALVPAELSQKTPLFFRSSGTALYISLDEPLLEQATKPPAPGQPSLASSPSFTAALEQLGTDGEIVAFANLKAAAASLRPLVERADPDTLLTWRMLDIDRLNWAAWKSRLVGGGFQESSRLSFYGEPTGVLGLLADMNAGRAEAVDLLPANATIAAAFNLEAFPQLFERAIRFAHMYGPPDAEQQIRDGLLEAGQSMGLDLRGQLLDHWTGEIAFFAQIPDLSLEALQNPIMALGLLDQARMAFLIQFDGESTPNTLNKVLQGALERGGIAVASETTARGKAIQVLTLPGSPTQAAYAIRGGWFVFGLNRASVEGVLDTEPGTALGSTLKLRELGFDEANLITVADLKRLGLLYGQIAMEAVQKKAPAGLDLSKVPPAEELVAELGPEVSALFLSQQTWRSEANSAIGGAYWAVAKGGIAAAVAIPSLLRSRMSANETSAAGSLKTIAAAQTDYNDNSAPHTFADLAKLGSGEGAGDVRYLDEALASGVKRGYQFTLKLTQFQCPGAQDTEHPDCQPGENGVCAKHGKPGAYYGWNAEAHPVVYQRTGVRSFYIDESGILGGGDNGGKPGDSSLPEL